MLAIQQMVIGPLGNPYAIEAGLHIKCRDRVSMAGI